jgi:hypothetical protein
MHASCWQFLADTCDVIWQSVRDKLVIAAFTFSLVSLCAVICTFAFVVSKRKRPTKKVANEDKVIAMVENILH